MMKLYVFFFVALLIETCSCHDPLVYNVSRIVLKTMSKNLMNGKFTQYFNMFHPNFTFSWCHNKGQIDEFKKFINAHFKAPLHIKTRVNKTNNLPNNTIRFGYTEAYLLNDYATIHIADGIMDLILNENTLQYKIKRLIQKCPTKIEESRLKNESVNFRRSMLREIKHLLRK
ncbi:unnamed protein product [Caenorhabditis bovis]|uniref:Uncharacterized protein n=1 Tax=Caenorhabditis bovis TaxID=2654633 RepID=A0A8S1EZ40_9PELO|nr:unnamed protein product [Caenorhabditis bovis]